MSIHLVLAAVKAQGGTARTRDLERMHYGASTDLAKLARQGYLVRTAPGHYRLAEAHQ
jgi:hypothetical protein